MAAARSAESAARQAVNDGYEWAEREGAKAKRPRGLYLFTPTPATLASGSARPDPGPDWTAIGDVKGTLPGHVAVLVHGLDEEGNIWDELAPALQTSSVTSVQFDYPNDGPIAQSAGLLADALRDLATRGVTSADLVCHSMGGLVARDVLTRPSAYGGDARAHNELPTITRCIMIGTPNQGSSWAHLEPLGEVREQVCRWIDDPDHDPRQLLGFLCDGHGEAATDLLPGSEYLKDLNARPLPTHVTMTAIVGEVRPTGPGFMPILSNPGLTVSILGKERAAMIAGGLRSAAADLGDGVVPVSSAELAGIEDTVRVCASHRGMIRVSAVERFVLNESTAEAAPAIPIIVDRLTHPAATSAFTATPAPAAASSPSAAGSSPALH
jgi:pimeloyl-ACP methyl ester carboxylesterase